MPAIRITSVVQEAPGERPFRGWHVGVPEPGTSCEGTFLRVAGWVAGDGFQVASVAVLQSGVPVTATPVALERPDVSAALGLPAGERTGFELMASVVALPPAFELTVWAEIVGASPVLLATIRGTHTPVCSGHRPAFQPISLTSLGRTGTTLLMSMLGAHPEVLVHDVFPYETRLGAYWMHAFAVLAAPANPDVSSHPDRFLEDPHRIGHNPWAFDYPPNGEAFRSWMRDGAVGPLAAFCQRSVEESYLRIAADQGKGSARYFAEKNVPTHVPRLLAQLYGGLKEIVLVRDFRDVLCSMVAFDARRGNASFRHGEEDFEALAHRVIGDFRRLGASWLERRDTALLVRYRDLVADPRRELARIASHIGVDASPAALAAMEAAGSTPTEESRGHCTTESWAGSVGRFRRDLPVAVQRLCAEAGADVLELFGYSTDAGSASRPAPQLA